MFSILIPVYNHARFLAQAVTSALRSSLVSEILIVDDGSTDDSPRVISKLAASSRSRIRNLTTSRNKNQGAPSRLNELVHAARSKWVAVLNSDDIFVVDRLAKIRAHEQFPRCDFIFGNLLFMNERGVLIGAQRGPFDAYTPLPPSFDVQGMVQNRDFLDLLSHENYLITTSNMIFTKELFARVGGFANFRYVHDWDFALRAMAVGCPLYLPRYITGYRFHSSNTIRENTGLVNLETKQVFERFSKDFPEIVQRPAFQIGMEHNVYLTGARETRAV